MEDKTLKYKEIICRHVFDDCYDNVIKNLRIINYAYQNKMLERKEEYKPLIKMFALLSSKNLDILKSFNSNQVLTENLYDAYKDVQNTCFEKIKSTLYTINASDLDNNLSKDNIKVYNIHKNTKNLLICTTRIKKTEKDLSKLEENINFRYNRKISQDYKSLSFVNNKNLKTYRDLNKYVTFVYSNDIPNNFLITISSDDAIIKFDKEGLPTSKAKPFYKESEKLLDATTYFNEIAILRNDNYLENYESNINSIIKPCALFCINEITPTEYEIARQLNIPIIYSESKYKYDSKIDSLKQTEEYFK